MPREEDVEATAEHARRWQAGLDTHPEEDVEALIAKHKANVYPLDKGEIGVLVAEVARLSGERDAYAKRMPEVIETHNHWKSRAVAAEAMVERLREAAKPFVIYGQKQSIGSVNSHRKVVVAEAQFQALRAALSAGAEQDDPHIFEPMSAAEQRAQGWAGAEQEAFCGRDDIDPHTWHHWRRRPDGSYGDYDDEGDLIRCPGSAGAEQKGKP